MLDVCCPTELPRCHHPEPQRPQMFEIPTYEEFLALSNPEKYNVLKQLADRGSNLQAESERVVEKLEQRVFDLEVRRPED